MGAVLSGRIGKTAAACGILICLAPSQLHYRDSIDSRNTNPGWSNTWCVKKISYKVMVAFGEQTFTLLSEEAKARGISIQELLRAVVIPDWFKAKYEPIPRHNPIVERRIREEEPVQPYSLSNKLRY